MRIAIALATYNGARFLNEQLASLTRQSRSPDHVVISDDGSSDETIAIAREFQRASSFPVDIIQGAHKLGPMGNFLRAAGACKAELIAFCDQDDIWEFDKVETCASALETTGAWLAIHSIDHFRDGDTNGREIVSRTRFASRTLDGLLFPPHRIILGMGMVIRKELLEFGAPLKALWEPRFDVIAASRPVSLLDHWSHVHDMFFLTVGRVHGPIVLIGQVLAHQRLHENNASGAKGGWSQPAEVASSWGDGRDLTLRLFGQFCDDFAMMLDGIPGSQTLSRARCERAIASYRRWGLLWKHRARLYREPPPGMLERFSAIQMAASAGAYKGALKGGLGPKYLVKDGANALGIRLNRT